MKTIRSQFDSDAGDYEEVLPENEDEAMAYVMGKMNKGRQEKAGMKHIEKATLKRLEFAAPVKKNKDWNVSNYIKDATLDVLQDYLFAIRNNAPDRKDTQRYSDPHSPKYSLTPEFKSWVKGLTQNQFKLAEAVYEALNVYSNSYASVEVCTRIIDPSFAGGLRSGNKWPTPSMLEKVKTSIAPKSINSLLPPKSKKAKDPLSAVRKAFLLLTPTLRSAVVDVESLIKVRDTAASEVRKIPKYAKTIGEVFKKCGYTNVSITDGPVFSSSKDTLSKKGITIRGESPDGAYISIESLTLYGDFNASGYELRIDGNGDSGFKSPVDGRQYTFNRIGVDAAWYPKFDLADATKLKDQVLEQKERALNSIERHRGGVSVRFGPKTTVMSQDNLDKIVQKLKAGQIHTLHPAGFGYAYTFSTKKATREQSKPASAEISDLVGKPVFYTEMMLD